MKTRKIFWGLLILIFIFSGKPAFGGEKKAKVLARYLVANYGYKVEEYSDSGIKIALETEEDVRMVENVLGFLESNFPRYFELVKEQTHLISQNRKEIQNLRCACGLLGNAECGGITKLNLSKIRKYFPEESDFLKMTAAILVHEAIHLWDLSTRKDSFLERWFHIQEYERRAWYFTRAFDESLQEKFGEGLPDWIYSGGNVPKKLFLKLEEIPPELRD